MSRLIDADEMRENLLWCKSQSSRYDNYWDDVIERLDVQPTIDAVPVVHGRWEYIPGDGKFRAILICSRCRRNVGEYDRFNYCPNCGAKMDLKEQQNGTDNP